jgi:hypothetical protein
VQYAWQTVNGFTFFLDLVVMLTPLEKTGG